MLYTFSSKKTEKKMRSMFRKVQKAKKLGCNAFRAEKKQKTLPESFEK